MHGVMPPLMAVHCAGDASGRFKGVLDCFVQTARQEGPAAFYKGFMPNFARLGTWNVIMFLTLEQVGDRGGESGAGSCWRTYWCSVCVCVGGGGGVQQLSHHMGDLNSRMDSVRILWLPVALAVRALHISGLSSSCSCQCGMLCRTPS
jgi:hypothetical protein